MAIKNQKRLSVTRILSPVALALALAACTATQQTATSVDITAEPTQSVQSYLMLADSSKVAFKTTGSLWR